MPNFTAKAIKESFIALLEQKPLSQITIKDIVAECGINRNSFYYHFDDLPSLIEEIVKDEADKIIEENPTVSSIEECFLVSMRFALNKKRAIYHIYNSINRDISERYLMRACDYLVRAYVDENFSNLSMKDADKELIIRYHKWLAFGAVSEWLENGMEGNIREKDEGSWDMFKGITEEMIRRAIENKNKEQR